MNMTGALPALRTLAVGLVVSLSLAGCGEERGSAADVMTVERLSGPTWRLVHMTQAGKKTIIPRAAAITLRVEANGRFGGRSAVNRYFGQLKTQADGSVSLDTGAIASTRMAGPPERMDLERACFDALAAVSRAQRTANALTLRSDDGATTLAFQTLE